MSALREIVDYLETEYGLEVEAGESFNELIVIHSDRGGEVRATLREEDAGVEIAMLVAEPTGRGYGSSMMEYLIDAASSTSSTLTLDVRPQDDYDGDEAQLTEFYSRYGFTADPSCGNNGMSFNSSGKSFDMS